MSKYIYSLLILACAVSSCQTIEELSIDYMVPSEISFPSQLRKVGVVNNVSATSTALSGDELKGTNGSYWLFAPVAKPAITTESLARSLAEQNYFDEVIICDSALRAHDHHPRENTLSRNEVNELTQSLDVDFLISLEEVQLLGTRSIKPNPFVGGFEASIDMKVYPVVKVYIPNRNTPMATITATDSIFWTSVGNTEGVARIRLIKDSVMVNEASEFAGTVPVNYILPYWKEDGRYYYAGGSVNMRDAAVYVREGSWDKAFALWDKDIQSVKSKKKEMYLSHNIALYYEMTDRFEEAEQWALKAKNLVAEIEKITTTEFDETDLTMVQRIAPQYLSQYVRATLYLQQIQARKDQILKLNAQMGRFSDDF